MSLPQNIKLTAEDERALDQMWEQIAVRDPGARDEARYTQLDEEEDAGDGDEYGGVALDEGVYDEDGNENPEHWDDDDQEDEWDDANDVD